MTKRGTANKDDASAREAIGFDAYDAIPKSVFAHVAFQFAMRIGDEFTAEAARREIMKEIDALAAAEFVTEGQRKSAARGFKADKDRGDT